MLLVPRVALQHHLWLVGLLLLAATTPPLLLVPAVVVDAVVAPPDVAQPTDQEEEGDPGTRRTHDEQCAISVRRLHVDVALEAPLSRRPGCCCREIPQVFR